MPNSYFEVRPSPIQGLGAFATRHIPWGARIIEYIGERISQEEADQRYNDNALATPHILLFTVNKRTVIDAGVGGNEAKFINHSCEPNCGAAIEGGHVFIEVVKPVGSGEELTYDYNLTWDDRDNAELDKRYPCDCGAGTCRGTMLAPERNVKRRRKRKSTPSHLSDADS